MTFNLAAIFGDESAEPAVAATTTRSAADPEERAAIGEVSTAEPPPELRRRVEATPDTWQNSDLTTTEEICPCGSSTWRDVVLHHEPHRGRSIRRDCGRCGRFVDFPIWYGSD